MQTIPFITYITQMHLLKCIVRTKLEYQKNLFQYTLYMLHFQLEYPAAMLQLPFSQFAGSRCYRICPPAIHSSLSHSTYKIINIITFRYTEKNFSPIG